MSPSRVPLGDIADFVNGVAFKPDDWEESGKRILRIQNLTDSTKPFNRTNRAVAKKYEVSPGDLLVSWSATLGVFVWEGPDTALVNQHIFRVVPDHGRIDPCYLRHMLSDALVQMEQHLHGATMKHVNRGEFLATTIPLPPLDEQKRIAGILDAADALRAKRREALGQLDILLQSTFLDMFGDPVTNPMGWEVGRLEDCFSETRAGTCCGPFGSALKKHEYVEDGIPVWGIDNVKPNQFIQERSLFITPAKFAQLRRYSVEPSDILISRAGTVGRMCVAMPAVEQSIIGSNLIRLTLNPGAMLPAYFACLYTFCGERLPSLRASGSDGSYSFLNTTRLKQLVLPVPPLNRQNRFGTIVESVEQQKVRQRAHLAELDTLFASLQSRAFCGDL